jgi:anti-sigma28 factor (negative regulator of flagellin synthesis)
MTIREIVSSGAVPDPVKSKKEKEVEEAKRPPKDTVSVSEDAKHLFEAEQARRVREIEERIASGYYFRREVTEKIADTLLQKFRVMSGS